MSKIVLISDTHFGSRDGRQVFHDFFEKFYKETFFPYLKKHGIKTVLHLGDCFDRRKFIDYYSLKRCKEYFFDPAAEAGIEVHMLVGNHDITYRNTLSVNSPELVLRDYPNVKPIATPTELSLPGCKFLMLPWICADNYAESMRLIKESDADVCCGHFEIQGFSMYRGMESHEGFDKDLFKRFSRVYSGHYHHRSSKDNIVYLGNPYEITAMDYNDPRGFHTFELATHNLDFVKNPFTLFERFVYNDTDKTKPLPDPKIFKDKFLKIVVEAKTDFYKFDQFLDKVYNAGCHEVKIVEDIAEMSADEMDDSIDIEDTLTVLNHYVDSSEVTVDKKKLNNFMKTLYNEALQVST